MSLSYGYQPRVGTAGSPLRSALAIWAGAGSPNTEAYYAGSRVLMAAKFKDLERISGIQK
jgi:hypothetical protein